MAVGRPVLYEYFRRTAESLLAKYQQTGVAAAAANLGSAREILVRGFLDSVVPPHLSVETGEIWDSSGGKSGQLDVVFLRSDVPRLPLGDPDGVSAFIAEGVYGVVEVKSNLSTEKLLDSIAALRRVAELKLQAPVGGFSLGQPLGRPIRAIFGFEGATFGTLAETLTRSENRGIADIICILSRGAWVSMWLAKQVGFGVPPEAPDDQYAPFDGRALGLAMFYYCLTLKAALFSALSVPLGSYFNPLNGWTD